jgi:hypothetical protein
MPRIYCTRHPSYSIYNRNVRYQFRDGVLDTDEVGGDVPRAAPLPEAGRHRSLRPNRSRRRKQVSRLARSRVIRA